VLAQPSALVSNVVCPSAKSGLPSTPYTSALATLAPPGLNVVDWGAVS